MHIKQTYITYAYTNTHTVVSQDIRARTFSRSRRHDCAIVCAYLSRASLNYCKYVCVCVVCLACSCSSYVSSRICRLTAINDRVFHRCVVGISIWHRPLLCEPKRVLAGLFEFGLDCWSPAYSLTLCCAYRGEQAEQVIGGGMRAAHLYRRRISNRIGATVIAPTRLHCTHS